ncbi:MAG: branched-chain amino acid ABC transporter permease [Proteobacteria bacterium]|nr:branched-chain amino acid ABC transporter permease [Pseudomonadota bacterium]
MKQTLTDLYSGYYAPNIKESYLKDEAIFRTRYQKTWFAVFAVGLLALPQLLGDYYIFFLTQVIIAVIGAHGLNILLGYTGQISLGHAAFLGVGGYTYSYLAMVHQWPFWLAIPASGLVAAGMGLMIGIPSLRIKGIYLGVATIAFQFIADYIYFHWNAFSGGPQGRVVEAPQILGHALTSRVSFYYIALGVAALLLWGAKNLMRSKYGRCLMAVRDNDVSAEALGVPVFKFKLLSFVISSFYAGVAGALLVIHLRNVFPDFFHLNVSIEYLAMVVVGGMGSIIGTIFGAIFIILVPEVLGNLISLIAQWLQNPEITVLMAPARLIVHGFLIVLFILIEPAGLAGIWRKISSYWKIWPLPYV